MSIGIVSDEDFNNELVRGTNVPELRPAQVIDLNKGGRKEGDNNIPDSLRKVIGEESVINGRASALALAKMFDVSPSSVSAHSNGATSTSTYHKKNQKLAEHLANAKLKIAIKARKRLNDTLEHITEDKLSDAKLADLAAVAKSMSGIIKDMTPTIDNNSTVNVNGPSIVMYNPGFRKEESFETIEVSE